MPASLSLLSLTVSRAGIRESNGLPLSEDRSVSPAAPEASEKTDGPGSISVTLCPQPALSSTRGAQLKVWLNEEMLFPLLVGAQAVLRVPREARRLLWQLAGPGTPPLLARHNRAQTQRALLVPLTPRGTWAGTNGDECHHKPECG